MSWAKALVEGERLDGGMGVLFFEGACHALQAQGAQLIERGVGEHRGFSGAGGNGVGRAVTA
jgi:hypothetical protein